MPSENRAIGRAYIPQLVREGLSISQIVNAIIDLGFGYHRETMFSDVHEFKGFLDREYLFRDYDPTALFSQDMMTETALRRVDYNYRVFGEANIYNSTTGAYETRMVSFYTNDLSSEEDYYDEYFDLVEESQYNPDEVVEGLKIIGIEHNEGYPY